MSLPLIVGIGIIGIILIYLSTVMDGEHFILKLMMLLTAMGLLILIPAATLEGSCDFYLNHTQTSGSSPIIEKHFYIEKCVDTTENNTENTFYKAYLVFYVAFWLYALVFLMYKVLIYLGYVVPKESKKR